MLRQSFVNEPTPHVAYPGSIVEIDDRFMFVDPTQFERVADTETVTTPSEQLSRFAGHYRPTAARR